MGAYNAVGGLYNRYKKRKAKPKSSYKKTSSKKKYKKTFKGKSKKVPDQRWTRMEYDDTHSGDGPFGGSPVAYYFTGNSNVRYMGIQNTGGTIPLTRSLAGSIVRDILSKNGIKYATWNSSAEGVVGSNNIWSQRCGKIKFYFRGQGPNGQLVDRDTYRKPQGTTPETYLTKTTEVTTYVSVPTETGVLRFLWDLTEEVRYMFVDCAKRGFYPVSYEVMTYTVVSSTGSGQWVVKFRDPNFGMSSVNMQITTDLNFTNQTPATEGATAGSGNEYLTNRSDTVNLKCHQYKFRNLAPFFRDDLLTATQEPLSDGTTHPFNEIHLSQKMDYDNGILDLSKWKQAGNMFRPFTTAPDGSVVFKNLASRYDCGTMRPGSMQKKKLIFKYNGGLRSLLVQVIPQTFFANASTSTDPATDQEAKALLNRVSKGDAFLFAFSRMKNVNDSSLTVPDIRVARQIRTSCYVQPFKSAPLPVCKNNSSDFTDDPGY